MRVSRIIPNTITLKGGRSLSELLVELPDHFVAARVFVQKGQREVEYQLADNGIWVKVNGRGPAILNPSDKVSDVIVAEEYE